jgi:hypothetical protein
MRKRKKKNTKKKTEEESLQDTFGGGLESVRDLKERRCMWGWKMKR